MTADFSKPALTPFEAPFNVTLTTLWVFMFKAIFALILLVSVSAHTQVTVAERNLSFVESQFKDTYLKWNSHHVTETPNLLRSNIKNLLTTSSLISGYLNTNTDLEYETKAKLTQMRETLKRLITAQIYQLSISDHQHALTEQKITIALNTLTETFQNFLNQNLTYENRKKVLEVLENKKPLTLEVLTLAESAGIQIIVEVLNDLTLSHGREATERSLLRRMLLPFHTPKTYPLHQVMVDKSKVALANIAALNGPPVVQVQDVFAQLIAIANEGREKRNEAGACHRYFN